MLGIEITKIYGIRSRNVLQSKMHPYRGREWYPCEDERAEYALGNKPPNFPVPAIIVRCDIWHDMVIWTHKAQLNAKGYFSRIIRKQ